MKYIVRVTDSGPLSFRDGRETTSSTTLDYVPGSMLLGGLAATHIRLRNDTNQFNQFFLSDSASFGNLYPSSFAHPDLVGDTDPVYPLPTTAHSCKRFGGFKFDEDDPKDMPHHRVHDTLIHQILFALSKQTDLSILAQIEVCPVCQASLDRIQGFYRRNTFDEKAMGKAQVDQGLRTRTGINRTTGTVQQGVLYSREILRSGTKFWGTLTVPDDQSDAFYEFIEEANTKHSLRLGNSRTRGFGRVNLELEEVDEVDSVEDIRTRIETFNNKLHQRADDLNVSMPDKLYLPLTLTADTIILDRLLRYQTAIKPAYLETKGIVRTKLIYQNSDTRHVIGWNELLRVPKSDEIAITKGSVFLFELSTPLNDELLKALLEIQNNGIGTRRREGFGRLLVASPFHWEVNGQ